VSVVLGAALARERLRSPGFWLPALGAAGLACAAGVEVRASDASGADRSLLGITLGVLVPLTAYAAFETVHRRESTEAVVSVLGRHGADRRRLALGVLLALAAATAAVAGALCALAVLAATTPGRGMAQDAYASAWGGALSGAGYAGLLAIGSRWGRTGRLSLLAADWLLGSSSGVLALPWVRGHARNLLGGVPVLDTSQSFAAAVLVVLAAFGVVASASRGPR